MESEPWLKDIFVFLAAAGLVVPLFYRMRLGAVLGFLVVGIAVGPGGLGSFAGDLPWLRYLSIDRDRVDPFAELGVIFLLFIIGLELSLPRLWDMRRFVVGIGGSQVALCGAAIGAVAFAAGVSTPAAIVLGLALAMSSTAIVLQLLEEQGRSGNVIGRTALSVLLFQDLMVAPVLFLTGVFGRNEGSLALAFGYGLLQAALAIVLIVVVGRFVLRPLVRFTARTGSRDLILAIAVLIVIAVAGATGLAGLSTALGAFLAGMLLGETEYRHQIEIDISPFKGLLIGLFFITVGMTIDLRAIWGNAFWIAAAVIGLLALKAAILFAVCRAFATRLGAAAELALLLAQAGEFAFVVVTLARRGELVTEPAAQFITSVVGLTMLATPLLAVAARRLGERLSVRDHRQHAPQPGLDEFRDHVVIGGYGRVGQTVARLLEAEKIDYVALDNDAAAVARHRQHGRPVYFGDASRAELLRRVGAAHARAFVVTLDHGGAAERMVRAVLSINAEASVLARAKDARHAASLARAGAVGVIPEAIEASLQLAGRLLADLGLSEEAVADRIATARAREAERLKQARNAAGA